MVTTEAMKMHDLFSDECGHGDGRENVRFAGTASLSKSIVHFYSDIVKVFGTR